ncbi:NACHT domain-containing protein [Steroidobacter flavus]|uniref:NACHT domain-containing protein n=1 Tax=Steroidobacter flavus TaxID=1842136 RepID=A0ABV8SJ91_9GAMM
MGSILVTSVAANALKKPIEDLYAASKDAIRRKLRSLATPEKLKEIQKSIKSVQKVKTMWRIDKEVPLTSFYYPSRLIIDKTTCQIGSVAAVSARENFIIQGTVGQGKSIFLRYLCVKELAASQRIPIFVELRRYDPSLCFKAFLISAVSLYRIACDEPMFDYLAESGKLVLLLDAFDEVEQGSITHVLSEIEALSQKYPTLQIVITSRPDSGIERSPHFRVYQLAPLTSRDHRAFLARIVPEKARVDEIAIAIEKSNAEIKLLLTTPLLLTLLVMVYNSRQEIPTSLSEFYDAIFFTLLTRHDKNKPGFRRKRESGLADSDLRKLFEAFCYAARRQDQLVLKDSTLRALLEQASGATGISCVTDAFIHDMTKVACLMLQEGFECHFIHKSVVEFHAAAFISSTSEDNARKFYLGVNSSKWLKWRQELEFLSQIDRLRYLKFFYVPSAQMALQYFGIDSVQTKITANTAAKILDHTTIVPVSPPESLGSCSFQISGTQGFVADLIIRRSFHRVIRPGMSKFLPTHSLEKRTKLGDFAITKGKFNECLAVVQGVVDDILVSLREAEEELAIESRVADFVSP